MILISLVGEQPIPIIIPILQSPKLYSDVLLLATSFTSDTAQNIWQLLSQEKYLKHIKFHHQIEISPYDITEIQERLISVLGGFEERQLPVTINLTGGTKIMSIAAQQIAASLEIPLIYVSSENNQFIHFKGLKPEVRVEDINVTITVDQYLRAHGLETSLDPAFNPHITSRPTEPKEGDSLENFVFNQINASGKFNDVCQNIWIRKHTSKGEIINELDVVATRNGKLVICSCKDRSNYDNEFIYELSSLSRREAAGIYCGKILALGKKVRPSQAFIDRARENGITLVFGGSIHRMVEYFLIATR